jgi:hypothetical protein
MAFGDPDARELHTCYYLESTGQRYGIEVQLMPVMQISVTLQAQL